MKIAFASEHPNNIREFSGTPCYMFQALHSASESLTYVEVPTYNQESVFQNSEKGLDNLRAAGEYLSSQLARMDVDVVICQGSSMIPFLTTDKPVVLWHDATWLAALNLDFEEFKDRYPLLYEWDCEVLERCDLIFFAADWVRKQTLAYYKTDPRKIHTLPFGANMLPNSTETVKGFIHDRQQNPCHLTFLAIDWRGKGLPLAYEVWKKLNQRGIRSELNVIGCNVNKIGIKRRIKHYIGLQRFTENEKFQLKYRQDKDVTNWGFLRKDVPEDYKKLSTILQNTHFLLHPASFECFGIAPVEANAFGIPVLAIDTHGLQTTIRNGLNGYLYSSSEYVELATDIIQKHMINYVQYQDLALSSFLEQQERLDWSKSVQRLVKIVHSEGIPPKESV